MSHQLPCMSDFHGNRSFFFEIYAELHRRHEHLNRYFANEKKRKIH
jgi:hypothetical protein